MEFSELILGIFLAAVVIQIIFYLFIYSKLVWFLSAGDNSSLLPATSVIIAARNEADHLLEHLPYVLEQNYPEFEVIVVNDRSVDETEDVLQAFQYKYNHLKVVTVRESSGFRGGKKLALTLGIKKASNDILVFTDADCRPASKQWLAKMAGAFDDQTEIILGYGGYEKNKSFLNKLIRFDTFMIALQYLSLALSGNPYMGVGRNLAYRKEVFFRSKGFAKHQHIASGDDDLFVNYAANKRNTKIMVDSDAHTISKSKTSFLDWFVQKKRHLTTGMHYNNKSKFILGTYQASCYGFMLLFIPLIVKYQLFYLIGVVLLVRYLTQFVIFKGSMRILKEKDILLLSPLYELFLFIFYPIFVFSNLIVRNNRWKS